MTCALLARHLRLISGQLRVLEAQARKDGGPGTRMCKGFGYSFYTWQMSWCEVYNQMVSPTQAKRRAPCLGVNYGRHWRSRSAIFTLLVKIKNSCKNNGLDDVDGTDVVDLAWGCIPRLTPATCPPERRRAVLKSKPSGSARFHGNLWKSST